MTNEISQVTSVGLGPLSAVELRPEWGLHLPEAATVPATMMASGQ